MTASLSSAISHEVGTTAVVFGEHGKIVLADPWILGSQRQCTVSELTVFRDGRDPDWGSLIDDKNAGGRLNRKRFGDRADKPDPNGLAD